MEKDKEFAVLVGKAFLRELDQGHPASAIAFGRAFLLALGMEGPQDDPNHHMPKHRHTSHELVPAEN